MQIFKENAKRTKLLSLDKIPQRIELHEGQPNALFFSNGQQTEACCLKCKNPRCICFSPSEISCNYLDTFSYDKNINVCPVNAIHWDNITELPQIDYDKCIDCGLCIIRCPIGALYFNNKIIVCTNVENDYFTIKNVSSINYQAQETQINKLMNIPKTGRIINETDIFMEKLYSGLLRIDSNHHNLIARNLLLCLNCHCAMRRVGDVYTRMDAIYYTATESLGAIEVEFGRDTLDASRGILDDIAILNTRYGISKNDNLALVICLQLPNERQGYWQVIKDINKVEGLAINTVTIGALFILLWNLAEFNPAIQPYYVDYDNMEIRTIMESQINKTIGLSDGLLGILEPIK